MIGLKSFFQGTMLVIVRIRLDFRAKRRGSTWRGTGPSTTSTVLTIERIDDELTRSDVVLLMLYSMSVCFAIPLLPVTWLARLFMTHQLLNGDIGSKFSETHGLRSFLWMLVGRSSEAGISFV